MSEILATPSPTVGRWRKSTARGVLQIMTDEDVALFRELGPELMRFSASMAGPSAAEGLFSSAVSKAFQSPRWPSVTNRRAYLVKCVFNEAANARRTLARKLAAELRLRAVSTSSCEPVGTDLDVLKAVKVLSVRKRAIVHLTYWSDLRPCQVGTTLGISTRTVERELAKSRNQLEVLLR